MAGVTAKEIPQISAFMGDFWNYIKSSYIPEESDEWWEECIACASNLQLKYNKDPLVVALLMAYLKYLDEKSRGEINNV